MLRVRVYSDIYFAAWAEELEPGKLPYGLEHLASDGFAITQSRRRRLSKALRRAEHKRYPFSEALQLCRGQSDAALAIFERQGIAHASLKWARIQPWASTPLVLVAWWLADDLRDPEPFDARVLGFLARSADLIIYFSDNQTPIFEALGVPAERLACVEFGMENDFYGPHQTSSRHVFTSVVDRSPDYDTLMAAASGLSVQLRVAAPAHLTADLEVPGNVQLLGELSHVDYRRELSEAAVVVVASDPEVVYPASQTVILNAMAAGSPLVATETPALSRYLRHGDNAWLVPPENPDALREGVERVLADGSLAEHLRSNGLAAVRNRYSAARMWTTIGQHMRAALSDHG